MRSPTLAETWQGLDRCKVRSVADGRDELEIHRRNACDHLADALDRLDELVQRVLRPAARRV